ncbi:MAG: NUDIX domain-containing protein [Acidobacteria bacterium]|nr:NUDIX domain-containing protein [Acidobacteriota bacterium]
MIDIPSLILLISEWHDPSDGEAEKSRELCLGLLRETAGPLAREQFTPGHITGTACILHPAQSAVLLVHHRKLDRWLLPGGHVESGLDGHIADTARREAEEETGAQIDPLLLPQLVGIDVHGIPSRKKEPFHLHHDLIFSFRATSEEFMGSEEVRALAWCPIERFDAYDLPISIRRAVVRSISFG